MNQLSHKKDQSSNATDYKRGTLYLLFYLMRHVSSIYFFLLPFILSFSPPHFPLLFCQCVAQSGPALAVKKKQKVYGVAFFFCFYRALSLLLFFFFSIFDYANYPVCATSTVPAGIVRGCPQVRLGI
ncbi:hypothetical protein DPX39_100140200 [Trypanosoma brucei equiperdum]|uniref:Uncharacterized protein n=1 Tax=Trypanosoma brucei equiperdum TaxID=630700 RepID=A0A3L6KZB3_9TRYP|nr:hypothetical protein DPX39_100140200 [Trypanosoma brucei equiperdum]